MQFVSLNDIDFACKKDTSTLLKDDDRDIRILKAQDLVRVYGATRTFIGTITFADISKISGA